MYGTIDIMKTRLLIDLTDDSYDTKLTTSLTEACSYIDNQLDQYTVTPMTVGLDELGYIAADIGCEYFRRRHMPKAHDDQHFFQDGVRRLEWFVKVNFKQGKIIFTEQTYGD